MCLQSVLAQASYGCCDSLSQYFHCDNKDSVETFAYSHHSSPLQCQY